MLSLRHGFVFVHVPKTGGNSVNAGLLEHAEDRIVTRGDQDGVERFELEHPLGTSKHAMLCDYQRLLAPRVFDALFKFSCVRNPWDRMISLYFSPHRKGGAWNRDEFLRLLERQPSTIERLTRDGSEDAPVELDAVMRFERLDDSYRDVCQALNLPCRSLPHRNASEHRPYRSYYDSELGEAVGARFSREIELFGYELRR